jgi:hypothetical protein
MAIGWEMPQGVHGVVGGLRGGMVLQGAREVVEANMAHVDSNRLGIVGAVVLAGWHAVWVVVHLAGFGQPLMDFAFRIHGLKSDVIVEPFDPANAALLLVVTAAVGYAVAAISGLLWNCLGTVCARGGAAPSRA